MQSQTIAVVVGTRPEAIKMAPLVLALRDHPRYRPVLISTAQHTEMLSQALGTFGLAPDISLGLARTGDTLEASSAAHSSRWAASLATSSRP